MYERQTLKVGDLAYVDTFAGLLPCKVTSITGTSGPAGSDQEVTACLTADCGAYKRGELMTRWGLSVVPRKSIRGRGQRVLPYDVEVPKP
ncbi:hypothetical protein [Aquabacterium sp.]|uniref:hypothetical protein n=1 Tax=Aquabacterium sp. TaxID=1872578 RepID=UPI004037B97B